jgi:iron(III) transport system substrate-binding protein
VASGECGVALANSYYLARILRSNTPEDKAIAERIGVVFPNQATTGTHMNIAGGAVARHAKHPDNALKFLNYLVSAQAQTYFADGNNEWPVVKGLALNNPALQAIGGDKFKTEQLPSSVVGMNQIKVQQMLDRVGFR